jgi:CRISPR-associated endonuclease Cas2
MNHDVFYLAAYDISSATRLQAALKVLRDYAMGRQKSVFECPLQKHQVKELLKAIEMIIDPIEDRFTLIKLDHRCTTFVLGKAVKYTSEEIFYIS